MNVRLRNEDTVLPRARSFMITTIASVVAITFASSASAQATKKPAPAKPACGIGILPFIAGTELIYGPVEPPGKQPSTTPPAKPRQPNKVTIKVVSVKVDKLSTEITLDEAADDHKYTTKLVCNRDGLVVPPESFFFSGEPGGGLLITLGDIQRTGQSYAFKLGRLHLTEWIEEIKAPFTRGAFAGTNVRLVNGSLDIQRVMRSSLAAESVTTALGTFDAIAVQVDLRGSIELNVGPEPKELLIPANTISKLWLAPTVGVVQVYNTNDHMYQLNEVKTPQ